MRSLSKMTLSLRLALGQGVITRLLAQKAKQVIAIEIDQRLVEQLKKTLPENVTLISGDALSVDFQSTSAVYEDRLKPPF